MKRLALKRLSASDLTFFEHHFRNTLGTKQKAINLDSRVFVKSFYPNINDVTGGGNDSLAHPLNIYGPRGAPLYSQMCRTLKQAKNWRMGGVIIRSDITPDRYESLVPDDLAIMVFLGGNRPERVDLFLISSQSEVDTHLFSLLHAAYKDYFGEKTAMLELSEQDLSETLQAGIDVSLIDESHQVFEFLRSSEALEVPSTSDTVPGSLFTPSRKRVMSKDQLNKRKVAADKIGADGEKIINFWLEELVGQDKIHDFEWVSQVNAIAPYDFEITDSAGKKMLVDAKSTGGVFENQFYISINELRTAADPSSDSCIYRVYELNPDGEWGKLRVARLAAEFVQGILGQLSKLPNGVQVDGVAVKPSCLEFGEEITLNYMANQGDLL